MECYDLFIKSLRRDAIDASDGLYAHGLDKQIYKAADAITELQDRIKQLEDALGIALRDYADTINELDDYKRAALHDRQNNNHHP
jgi:hypothetical protein